MHSMQAALQQQQAWVNEQAAIQQAAQAREQAKIRGIEQGRAEDATTRQIMKIRTHSMWAGLQVLTVVSFTILLFLYNSVFANDKRIFWVLTSVMVAMLIYKFTQVVREDGGLALGHL